jgi:hypothetical protein
LCEAEEYARQYEEKDREVGEDRDIADGSSLETLADGSVVLREGRLARAAAVGSRMGSESASPPGGISYDDPAPQPPREGGD